MQIQLRAWPHTPGQRDLQPPLCLGGTGSGRRMAGYVASSPSAPGNSGLDGDPADLLAPPGQSNGHFTSSMLLSFKALNPVLLTGAAMSGPL